MLTYTCAFLLLGMAGFVGPWRPDSFLMMYLLRLIAYTLLFLGKGRIDATDVTFVVCYVPYSADPEVSSSLFGLLLLFVYRESRYGLLHHYFS